MNELLGTGQTANLPSPGGSNSPFCLPMSAPLSLTKICVKYVRSYWESFRVNKTPAPTSLKGIDLEPSAGVGRASLQRQEETFTQPGLSLQPGVSLL